LCASSILKPRFESLNLIRVREQQTLSRASSMDLYRVSKEKAGKQMNVDLAEYLEEEEVQKLIE